MLFYLVEKISRKLSSTYVHTQQRICSYECKGQNIFIDTRSGQWLLGDFGSCVKVGEAVISTTLGLYPINVGFKGRYQV